MKNNLREIRKRFCVSQERFAEMLDVTQGNISNCERQEQEVTPDMARRVIAAGKDYGVDVTFDDIYDTKGQQKAA